jgi:hypothetical protein
VSPDANEDYLARIGSRSIDCRVWRKRFYDFNVWSEKKQLEKLDCMHGNPVQRELVTSPADVPWSSWRFYHLNDTSIPAHGPSLPNQIRRHACTAYLCRSA